MGATMSQSLPTRGIQTLVEFINIEQSMYLDLQSMLQSTYLDFIDR